MLFIFRGISACFWLSCFRPFEIWTWPWKRLSFILINYRFCQSFSWIFIHFSRKRTYILFDLIFIWCRNELFNMQNIVNVVSFMWRFWAWSILFLIVLMIMLWNFILKWFPLIVSIDGVIGINYSDWFILAFTAY